MMIGATGWVPASVPFGAAGAELDVEVIRIDDLYITSLSPDGRWFAGLDGAQSMCVVERTGVRRHCRDTGAASVSLPGVLWAPDSSAIAAQPAAAQVLTPAVGLTTAGSTWQVAGEYIDELALNLSLVWSPDSSRLAISQWILPLAEDDPTFSRIVSYPVDGGPPDEIVVSDADLLIPWHWDGDAETIYYAAHYGMTTATPTSTLWAVPATGGKPRRLLDSAALNHDDPIELAVSDVGDDGELLVYAVAVGTGLGPNGIAGWSVNPKGGVTSAPWLDPAELTLVVRTTSMAAPPAGPRIFTPDGAVVSYYPLMSTIVVAADAQSTGTPLAVARVRGAVLDGWGLPSVAEDGTLFVPTKSGAAVLADLSAE